VFFARVEDELSRFRSTSALTRLNGAAGRGPQAVSPLFWTVLMSAMEAADDSGGIYDPTLLRALERIGYDRTFDEVERCGTMNTIPDGNGPDRAVLSLDQHPKRCPVAPGQ